MSEWSQKVVIKLGVIRFWWIIELDFDSVLGHGFVIIKNFLDTLFGQDVENRWCLISHLNYTSSCTVVWFHTSKIPSREFFLVNNTITVQIQVLQSHCKFIITQWLTKHFGERTKLILIYRSVTILIKFLKGFLHSLFKNAVLLFKKISHMANKVISTGGNIIV